MRCGCRIRCSKATPFIPSREVLETRESKSRANVGIVKVKTIGYNHEGKVVIEFKRTLLVFKRGRAPQITRLAPPSVK